MSSNSHIQWTNATWNPVAGCSIKSPGCKECYAMKMAARLEAMGQTAYAGLTHKVNGNVVWTGLVRPLPERLEEPLRWRKPRLVFVNSMSDLFHERMPVAYITQCLAVMALCPQHTFQVLTKRADVMQWVMSGNGQAHRVWEAAGKLARRLGLEARLPSPFRPLWPLPNVWLGTSVERQQEADERIPWLLQTPAAIRFLSCEPLLDPLNLHEYLLGFTAGNPSICACGHGHGFSRCPNYGRVSATCHVRECGCTKFRKQAGGDGLGWVIAGGESGPGARVCDVGWIKSLVDQCQAAAVPCFVKQLGRWIGGSSEGFNPSRYLLEDLKTVFVPPVLTSRHRRPSNAVAFSLDHPKGGDMREWPASLRVRELPADPARAGG